MRNEIKVGILAIISIAFGFWGYKFIQGKNILSATKSYHAYYDDINGLSVGSALKISGVVVGSVSAIELDQMTRKVRVDMEVSPAYRVPKNTVAYIASDGFLGGMKIDLFYAQPCAADGTDCLPEGSEIRGASRGMLSSFLNTDPNDPTGPIMGQVDTALAKLNATFFGEDSDHPIARSSQDLAATMANLNQTTAQLQQLMEINSRQVTQSMRNLAILTDGLASRQAALVGIIDNTQNFTGNLSEMDVEATLEKVNQSIEGLQTTLQKANEAMGGVSGLMDNINSGKGTLGKLLQDDAIYEQLSNVSGALDTLLIDFQERPYRYMPLKSRKKVIKFDKKDTQDRAEEITAIPNH